MKFNTKKVGIAIVENAIWDKAWLEKNKDKLIVCKEYKLNNEKIEETNKELIEDSLE